jgi:VIT1/CCC1 family predicted Fe2+/Mn2+ transporter
MDLEYGLETEVNRNEREKHPHIPARRIMDRIVLGGSDGAIEGVAMTAALNGAGVGFGTIVIAGLAFAIAGSASMFVSSYLARKSEKELLQIDIEREKMEIETEPEEERAELEKLLRDDGYRQEEVDVIMGRLVRDKELWLREQLRRELRVHTEDLAADPYAGPASAGLAFLMLALLAVAPYAFLGGTLATLTVSVGLSLAALFVLSSRVFVPKHFDPVVGLESALTGGAAAALLYVAGLLIARI